MKILYVTTVSNTINAFLIPHIKMLVEQGNSVDVAFNIKDKPSEMLASMGCHILNVEFQRTPFSGLNILAFKKIMEIIKTGKYDIVHVHTPVASFITRLACKKIPDTKVYYTAHGFHFFKGAPWKNWLLYFSMEKLAARWTDVIITINNEDYLSAQKFRLKKGGKIYRIQGVGVNLEKFAPMSSKDRKELRKKYEFKEDDFLLLYTAELNENKHQDLLIKAVCMLKQEIPTIKLLLAGSGEKEYQYKSLVKTLNLDNEVKFLGFRKDIPELLNLVDLVVSSSRREGLPVNIMEAMAAGRPLVVTDCRGNRDLVTHGENGYIVGCNDVEGFTKAVGDLFYSNERRNRFGDESLKKVKKYSIDQVIKEIEEIYCVKPGNIRLHG
ncbi:glycosyltransferase family 4 protein [Neobacillus drentensis]|uniref:glycosyltransferase family 4 protein n=1 Tax=Neobacillus drentensis TaxID=220684 RepID=UPI0008260886|nr:glycosyltransferase family 4 protein [Neobacillus drentensis]